MKVIEGLFIEREKDNITIYETKNVQQSLQLTLHIPWVYFPFSKVKYLTPIRIINPFYISKSEYETIPDTLILLNPDILINSRTITSASECARKVYLEYVFGESKMSLPMVRGSIIHDVFSAIVSNGISVTQAIKDGIEKFTFPLSYLKANVKELIEDIKPVVNGLAQSAITLRNNNAIPEMLFLSPIYGVSGRLDFWSSKELYELKTGRKVPLRNTWFSDQIQTIIYMHGLSPTPKAVSKSSVIYSGEGTPVFRQTILNYELLHQIHMARNYCYLVYFEGWIPPAIQTKKCSRCFKKEECDEFKIISEEKDSQSSTSFQYLSHFLSLIRLEHLKNRQDFSYLWKLTPKGRVKAGKAIKDLSLTQKEEEIFNYRCQNTSELRLGEPVILSQGNPIFDNTSIAMISEIDRHSVTLKSRSILPKKAYLDSYSSDFTFRRLNKNIFSVAIGEKAQHKTHKFIILGEKPTFSNRLFDPIEDLDASQQEAVQLVMNSNDYSLIQGPAGTGKTYTIAKLIELLRSQGKRILLSAYTNTAVDNILLQFLQMTNRIEVRKEIVRLGLDQVINFSVRDLALSNKKLSYTDLVSIPIVAATTSTIARNIYDDLIFDIVIVDEASQMTEPSVLSAVTKGERFVLVGDDKQLPPLVQSYQAVKLGFGTSLFERLRKLHPEASKQLKFQYRMNSDLMDFSSKRYYNESVQAASTQVATQLLWDLVPENQINTVTDPLFQIILDPNQPLVYVEIQSYFDRRRRVNKREVEVISEIIAFYLQMGIKPHHIGVITPFRGQVAEINRRLGLNSSISVDTIDRFQGSDKELIILSLCTVYSPHILEDERRLNVSLTRGKKKMIIVGGFPDKQSITLFQELYSHIEQNHSLVRLNASEVQSKRLFKSQTKPTIEARISHQALAHEDMSREYSVSINHNTCVLCQKPVEKETILRCPICNQAYHRNHLIEWLNSHEICVTCQTRIELS
ncbi:MAG: AAA domain-containing protein [Candidatus Hodarchaeales archaeon]|jgi:DNA replication ATP-dependent helicase Dna2